MSTWLRIRLVLDRVIAAVLLMASAPVIAICAVLVRRHDGGPPLIAVPRVGQRGEPMQMWKLRSMRAVSPTGMATGVPLTTADDPRVTPIGATLRAYHLDELPQLYNVVRGDMCLLGPRPEDPAFVDLDDPRWQEVLAAPPGMAGPTQLIVDDWERDTISEDPSGVDYLRIVLPVKQAIDAWYLRTASPRLDALIVGTLIAHLATGHRGVALRRRVLSEVPQAAPAAP